MTPAPVCIERQESVFSVTGFLTFVVVAATAVSNVIANIDNNNNNNNNNDNNDNVNNNNQISDSNDVMNMGNAGGRYFSQNWNISQHISLPKFICQSVKDIQETSWSLEAKEAALVCKLLGKMNYPLLITTPTISDIYSKCCIVNW